LAATCLVACAQQRIVTTQSGQNGFPLAEGARLATLVVDKSDFAGVKRAVNDLQKDFERVTGVRPVVADKPAGKYCVIIGTLGESPLVNDLVRQGKIDITGITGKWETYLIQTIDKPMKGVDRALVIAGSDKRGTIYGVYEISKQIGVSPWYWWADVPPEKSGTLYVNPGRYTQGEPGVKYRGIFLNDEEPALGRWAVEKYGGFNHQFYEKLFELLLRLKGNYLWPAMWWASFNSDDPLNPKIADEYGVVIGTTHHEPMNRAHAEWKTFKGGAWNYETNERRLREFWTQGIERMRNYETIVSLAMRGDGDMAMTPDTNIALLQRIVKDQREIIAQVTGKDITQTPQLWALYKEVQDYYDKGMRVPDDVTLLLCDDNWGNIRKLPKLAEPPRAGGYGIYYHFDYVGGPRNYKWLNTSPIVRVWEQMNLAYQYGANEIWIVNVGDLKPMEFPISFFLDMAWSPSTFHAGSLQQYTERWAGQQFGTTHAVEIADIISKYTKFNGRRKPELLSPDTYSLQHYRENETIVAAYNALADQARKIGESIPDSRKDAYYQLVLHPVEACANLNDLYYTVARNRLYASQGRTITNDLATRARQLFDRDAALSNYYNHKLAGGKWNNMMNQTHISYTYWQQPEKDVLPRVENISVPPEADMGVAVEGSTAWWPHEKTAATLPVFDAYNRQSYYIEVFNRGETAFDFSVSADVPWVRLSEKTGSVEKQKRIEVTIDWNMLQQGDHNATVAIVGPRKKSVQVKVTASKQSVGSAAAFLESNGYVSIEAAHFTSAVSTSNDKWLVLPDHGRTGAAVTTYPVTSPSRELGSDSPCLEYAIYLDAHDSIVVNTIISPTIDFHNNGGLRYAISLDDEEPQVINIHKEQIAASLGEIGTRQCNSKRINT
ncbi:MAG: glycosyl hydrolase, partial [Bacteroidia bacterium]|nr:glycosyl hydrolase [Bacteroidia bacterium]